MYCIHCGERVVESAQFCAACGEKIQRPQDEKQRPERAVSVPPISENSETSGDLITDAVPEGERQHSEPVVAEAPHVESVVTPAEEITLAVNEPTSKIKPVERHSLMAAENTDAARDEILKRLEDYVGMNWKSHYRATFSRL